ATRRSRWRRDLARILALDALHVFPLELFDPRLGRRRLGVDGGEPFRPCLRNQLGRANTWAATPLGVGRLDDPRQAAELPAGTDRRTRQRPEVANRFKTPHPIGPRFVGRIVALPQG